MALSGQLHVPADLRQDKTRYPFDKRLGGPQSRSERGGEEKRIPIIAPAGNWTPLFHSIV
jgi:hypothetical protein